MNGRLTAGRKKSFSYEGAKPQKDSSNQWSGTENNRNNARNVNFNNGNANNNNKYNGNVVRPVAASQDYDVPESFVNSVWEAYHDCLRGKMRSKQAVEYMEIANEDIPVLAQELWSGTYHPGTSTCFLSPLSETERGVRGELQGPHRASLDMPSLESVVRGTLREARECVVQLPQGVWNGESRASCSGRNEEGERLLPHSGMGVQRRSRWILHVNRQGSALVSFGTLHPSPAQALRAGRMENARLLNTRTPEDDTDARNVLGHPYENDNGGCHAPSGTGLHTQHRPKRMAQPGEKQEPVHIAHRRTHRKPHDAVVRQLPDVILHQLCSMAVQREELLHGAVCGRFRHCMRRPPFPRGKHTEDRGIPAFQTSPDAPQAQEISSTRLSRCEVRRHLHQAWQTLSFQPNAFEVEGTLPRVCDHHGRERIGGLGQGTHGTDIQLVPWIHKEENDVQLQKGKHRRNGTRLLA